MLKPCHEPFIAPEISIFPEQKQISVPQSSFSFIASPEENRDFKPSSEIKRTLKTKSELIAII